MVDGDREEASDTNQPEIAGSEQAAAGSAVPEANVERPRSTRTSRVWIGTVLGLVVLIAILIFIIQNLESVSINFPDAAVRMPVGIAILFGVILGGIFVFLLGLARVLQLRHGIQRGQGARSKYRARKTPWRSPS
jgi:uncharacterized integral membrane protein